MRTKIKALLACLLFAAAAPRARATVLNKNADVVLGQFDFTKAKGNNTDAVGFDAPNGVAIDTTTGRIFMVDGQNHRVLWWNNRSTLVSGQAADGVLGQADFLSGAAATTASRLNVPSGIALDAFGNLWVGDAGNNRVLEFVPPYVNGMSASIVLGQTNFTTKSGQSTQNGLNNPIGVAFDKAGDLWVADSVNNRVVEYVPPFATNMLASLVLGQSTWSVSGSALTQTGMSFPYAVAVDTNSGDVFVADQNNRRVLVFAPPLSSGMNATAALGEPNFTTNGGGTTAALFGHANGVAVDGSGNAWVSDDDNNRVLKFAPPFSTAMSASLVIGHGNFTTGGGGTTAALLNAPRGMAFDASTGDLWVADALNPRVLKYPAPLSTGMSAALVLGQNSMTHGQINNVDGTSINGPRAVAIDTNTARVYIVDQNNARVLFWNSIESLTNGKAADGVLGQTGFTESAGTGGAAGAAAFGGFVTGLLVDGSGNVWVSDDGCPRVLKFAAPVVSGMSATLALGQANPSACAGGGATQSQFSNPAGLAMDSTGALWVADAGNHRALKFVPPFSNGMLASVVIGQSLFTTNTAGFTAATVNGPAGVAVDASGNLWLADSNNNRILEFPAPQSSGMSATLVLGQPDFVSSGTLTTQRYLRNPTPLTFDAAGNLWVGDNFHKRVVSFAAPFSTFMNAAGLLGEPNFTTANGGAAQATIGNVYGLAVSSSGDVVAAETDSNRALVYFAPPAPAAPVQADTSSSTLTWSWSAAASATGYAFYPSTGGPPIMLPVSTTTLTQVGLSSGTGYGARIAAVYAYGIGPASALGSGRTTILQSVGAGGGQLNFTQTAGATSLIIPPNAFGTSVNVTLQTPASLPAGAAAFGSPLTGTGVGLQITLDQPVQPQAPCLLTIGYRPADLAGVNAATLVLARYDPVGGAWVPLPSTVDSTNRTVSAAVGHFSLFQIMGAAPATNIWTPRIFPNPFRPALGHNNVTFANLPAGITIKLFTLTGRLVREFATDAVGMASWDGNNTAGAPVASGVYFALVADPSGTKTFKVIVQR